MHCNPSSSASAKDTNSTLTTHCRRQTVRDCLGHLLGRFPDSLLNPTSHVSDCEWSAGPARSRMSAHSMAWPSTCLHGLHRVSLSCCRFRQGLTGRCLHSLAARSTSRVSQRQVEQRAELCHVVAMHQQPFAAGGRPGVAAPLCSLLPPAAASALSAGISGGRQLHASTVCFGKKKSAEGLVKRIIKGSCTSIIPLQ